MRMNGKLLYVFKFTNLYYVQKINTQYIKDRADVKRDLYFIERSRHNDLFV